MGLFNKCQLIGNTGKEHNLRYLQSGTAIFNTKMAVSNPYKKDEQPMWVKLIAWGETGEKMNEILKSGSSYGLIVEGEVGMEVWKDNDGTAKGSITVTIRDWQVNRWPDDGEGNQNQNRGSNNRQQRQPQQPKEESYDFD